MSITVMKQALEALELNNSTWKALADSGDAGWWLAEEQDHYKQTEQAITSLRQAIAEAEKQEPVKQFAQESFMQLWQSYCDKKMEVEDLKEQLETLTQPEQEPWVCECGADSYLACKCSIKSPPQRQWVGLNWDDLPEIYVGDIAFLHGAKWAEAKLKEKNA